MDCGRVFSEMSVPSPARINYKTGCLVNLQCSQVFEHDLTGLLFQETMVPRFLASQGLFLRLLSMGV